MTHDTERTAAAHETERHAEMHVESGGQGYQAERQYFFERRHLTAVPVEPWELHRFDRQDFYVEPVRTEDWQKLPSRLVEHGVLVLRAASGTGRRTTAQWLARHLPSKVTLVDLEGDWDKPDVKTVPEVDGHVCILDMSSPAAKDPDERFGHHLAAKGADLRDRNQFLIVLTTPEVWQGSWTEGARPFTVDLAAPDGRELVRRTLVKSGGENLVPLLDQQPLKDVWKHRPRALATRNLATRLLRVGPGEEEDRATEIQALAEQYTGWRSRINTLLSHEQEYERFDYGQTIARSVIWSGALHEGCRPSAVIRGADHFLKAVAVKREAAAVFAEPTAMRKFELASLTEEKGLARFEAHGDGLAQALLEDLWDTYSHTKRRELLSWIRRALQDKRLDTEEVRLVALRVVELAVKRADGDLFQALRDALVQEHRAVAVEILTKASLSSASGTYVRGLLYTWATKHSDPNVLALVSEICGGALGEARPSVALTRLRLVAANGPYGFHPLQAALEQLLSRSDEAAGDLRAWLDGNDNRPGRLGTLLALAHKPSGTRLLLGEQAQRLTELPHKSSLAQSLRELLSEEASGLSTHRALMQWGEKVQAGDFEEHHSEVTDLLVEAYAGPIHPAVGQELRAGGPYWQSVHDQATELSLERLKSA